MYESPLKQFLPKHNDEHCFSNARNHRCFQREAQQIKSEIENNKKKSETILQIEDVLESIKTANLTENYRTDENQKKLLKERIENAQKMTEDLLEKVASYINSIEKMLEIDVSASDYNEQRMVELDTMRTRKHDALISSLQSTVRYISHTFAKIDEEAIENWEELLEERGQEILEVERIELPEKIYCPDNIDLTDRKQIMHWANTIFNSLTIIKDHFKK